MDHVGLSVTDLARSTAFYCDVLGAEVVVRAHDAGSFRRVVLRLGSSIFDVNEFHENDGSRFDMTRTGLDHLSLVAASREALDDWACWLDANDVARSPIRPIPAPAAGGCSTSLNPTASSWSSRFLSGQIGAHNS
jgi:catechol 2,3-dioxygenase-like lactoylglutathione lyase family enzyme